MTRSSACNAYAPTISSPLNPKSRPARPRSRGSVGGSDGGSGNGNGDSNSGRGGRRGLNLAQHLLRAKAAEAWRDYVLIAQVAQYEDWALLQQEEQEQTCGTLTEKGQRLTIPDMTAAQIILAMGLVGVLPALSMQGLVRPS